MLDEAMEMALVCSILLAHILSRDLGGKGSQSESEVIKSFVSDLGGSCLLPAFLKL